MLLFATILVIWFYVTLPKTWWIVSGYSKLNLNLMVLLIGTTLIWSPRDLHSVGLGYHSTLSPIVKPTIVCLVVTITTQLDCHVHQLDVNNAFLQIRLTEEVFM